ncbi:MAG: hypothetical protein GSR80_001729 [Desulfurococcales archaeon]|nr:hypothetical protein [Desulfurococcales archaeon]
MGEEPPVILDVISSGGFLFYYGEPAVGKTRLAGLLARNLESAGFRPCYIATEAGSIAVEDRLFAVSMDHMLEILFKCLTQGRPAIIDTINSYYTGERSEAKIMALAAAISRASSLPVIAAGQVRGEGSPWGGVWVEPWATHVAVVERLKPGVSVIRFIKPRRVVAAFRVGAGVRGSVEWI